MTEYEMIIPLWMRAFYHMKEGDIIKEARKRINVSPATYSRLINKLRADGFVNLESCGRTRKIHMTIKGVLLSASLSSIHLLTEGHGW